VGPRGSREGTVPLSVHPQTAVRLAEDLLRQPQTNDLPGDLEVRANYGLQLLYFAIQGLAALAGVA